MARADNSHEIRNPFSAPSGAALYSFEGVVSGKWLSRNLGLAIALLASTVIYIGWSILRSQWLYQGEGSRLGVGDISFSDSWLVVLALTVPVLAAARWPDRGLWLLGSLATFQIFPSVPHLPFITEYGHVVVWAIVLCASYRLLAQADSFTDVVARGRCRDPVVILVGLFVMQGALSLMIGLASEWSLYEAKVGMAELLKYSSFGILLYLASLRNGPLADGRDPLIAGMKTAIWLAIGIGSVGVVATLLTPLVPGNDTALGFGYWARLKSTFSGPNHAGHFYAASIPLMFYFGGEGRGSRWKRSQYVFGIVSLVVLIMATGSRAARLAALIPLAAALLFPPYRRMAQLSLPFVAVAYYFGFYFRSLRGVINVNFGDGTLAYDNIWSVFWTDPERIKLIMQTLGRWFEDPFVLILGDGPGLSGYIGSGFPQPHMTLMNILAEQGVVGLAILAAAVLWVARRLIRNVIKETGSAQRLSLSLMVALTVLVLTGLTFDNHTWSYVWCFFLAASWQAMLGAGADNHGTQREPVGGKLASRG